MTNRKQSSFFLLLSIAAVSFQMGCIGYSPPHVFQQKPWTLLSEGEQLGRDQLANRFLVAYRMVPIKGWHQNEVLSVLGQPQEIQIMEREVSEDWYFVYYKNYKTLPKTKEGTFIVRFYQDKVMDVVKIK